MSWEVEQGANEHNKHRQYCRIPLSCSAAYPLSCALLMRTREKTHTHTHTHTHTRHVSSLVCASNVPLDHICMYIRTYSYILHIYMELYIHIWKYRTPRINLSTTGASSSRRTRSISSSLKNGNESITRAGSRRTANVLSSRVNIRPCSCEEKNTIIKK